MKIKHDLKPWQLALGSFVLAWWLWLAPPMLRGLWTLLISTRVPDTLDWWLPLSRVALLAGGISALQELDEKKAPEARIIATYFVLGALSIGLLSMLGLPVGKL